LRCIDFYQRRAGVLLHPTSLPSGTLDDDTLRWIDFLADAGFSVWQVLPLGQPRSDLSPYQCYSAFALNPALLKEYRMMENDVPELQEFCVAQQYWLDDYVLFCILKLKFSGAVWYEWPVSYRDKDPDALASALEEYATEALQFRCQQYELYQRWLDLKEYANTRGIQLFGDMPVFVAHDSADVWAHREQFLLNENGMPTLVAGVPPDYFSDIGQRWGNPHFNWDVMQAEGFDFWMQRLNNHLTLYDFVRIDHFRGLEASWMIDANCQTAIDGYWQPVPGDNLLAQLSEEYTNLPIIAEDLGFITEQVIALRKKYHLPGMSVLQFGFDEHADNPHKVINITDDRVVYTGTHDNNTTRGWYEGLPELVQKQVTDSLGLHGENISSEVVVDTMIDNALACPASMAIIPLQDILHLDSTARMNVPGTTENNWQWRFDWDDISTDIVHNMRQRIEKCDRGMHTNV